MIYVEINVRNEFHGTSTEVEAFTSADSVIVPRRAIQAAYLALCPNGPDCACGSCGSFGVIDSRQSIVPTDRWANFFVVRPCHEQICRKGHC